MDRYEARLKLHGVTKRERDLYRLKQVLIKNLPESLAYKQVKINDEEKQLIFTKNNNGYDIISLPNETFNTGDYVTYKELIYLVTFTDGDDEIYTTGKMELCTYTLKFQHPKTGEILSYPCITSNRIQGIGEKENNIMTLPAGNKVVLLPFDENTILLQNSATKIWRFFVDNHPINPRPYKLTFADTTSRHGLVELYCTEDELIPNKDRIDLGICDYFEPTAPSHDDKYITITSSGKLVIGGIQRTYTATLFENNVEQPFNPIWNIDYNSMPEKCFVIMYEGNKCMIRIKDDYEIYNHIGKELIISCSTEDGIVSTDYKTIVSI